MSNAPMTTSSPSPTTSRYGASANARRYSGRSVLAVVAAVVVLTVAGAIALFFQIGRRRTAAPAYPAGVGVETRGANGAPH